MDVNWAQAKISRIFGGRYELERIITESAHFFEGVGSDVIGSRQVALTVFAPAVNDHEDNTKAIYSAARQLSTVEHINVCSPTGWSETDDCIYVVSEQVPSVNLADLLAAGHQLSPSQTLVLALEVTRALEHCHNLGITHGDLRPENIWIGTDQRVRIAGFGLARAIFHLPAPENELIEATRYSSPERAQGQLEGSAGDIYALALIVNEILTAAKPPVGESLVATLMQRSEYEIELTESATALGSVFGRCGALEVSQRPDATELAKGLLEAAESLARPDDFPGLETLSCTKTTSTSATSGQGGSSAVSTGAANKTVVTSQHDSIGPAAVAGAAAVTDAADADTAATDAADADAASGEDVAGDGDDGGIALCDPYLDTEISSDIDAIVVTAEDVAEVDAVAAALDHPTLDEILGTSELIFDPDTGQHEKVEIAATDTSQTDGTEVIAQTESTAYADKSDSSDQAVSASTSSTDTSDIAGVTGATSAITTTTGPLTSETDTSQLDIPDFDAPVARRGRAIRGLDYGDDENLVLPKWPLVALFAIIAGAIALALVYSPLLDDVAAPTAPDFLGRQIEEVETAAEENGWRLRKLQSRQDATLAGQILLQDPAPGKTLHSGDQLVVTVSLGNEMVELPGDIIGLTVQQAQIRLNDFGILIDSTREVNSEALSAGLVVSYDEPTNQKPAGETVKLVVSKGPQQRVVPDNIIGMTQEDATDLLASMRLKTLPEPVYDPDAKEGSVLQVEPAPGVEVAADSEVTIYVSAGPEPVEIPDVTGMTLEEAIKAVQELGLFFTGAEGTAGEPAIATVPEIGEIVDVGTEITIVLGEDNGDGADGEGKESSD